MKIPKVNKYIIINGLYIMILGFIGKPSVPISAPANNASVLIIAGGILLVIGLYSNNN